MSQRTLADFKPPFSAEFYSHKDYRDPVLGVFKNGILTASFFPVVPRSEQACIDAALDYLYGPNTPSEIDSLRELNAELLEALKAAMKFINANVADPDITTEMAEAWCALKDANPDAAIAKAEGRT